MKFSHYRQLPLLLFIAIFGIGSLVMFTVVSTSQQSSDNRSQASEKNKGNAYGKYKHHSSKSSLMKDFTGINQKIRKSITNNTTTHAELETMLKDRQSMVLEIMELDPATILSFSSETQNLRLLLPTDLQSYVESKVSVEGTIVVTQSDDLTKGSTAPSYVVTTGTGQKITLHFLTPAPIYKAGTRVRVTGFMTANNIVVVPSGATDIEVLPSSAPVLGANTQYKIAVILVNFQNDQSQPFTPDTVRQTTFTDTNTGVNAYYQVNSFDKYGFQGNLRPDGDVFGWYTIPFNNTSCDNSNWAVAADQSAAKDGFDPSAYKAVVYAFPYVSACSWGGRGTYGGYPAQSWINGFYTSDLVSHELGHNLGTAHANAYHCVDASGTPVAISTSCTSTEYGDPFDVMGAVAPHRQFNIFHKGQSNFLDNSSSNTITTSGDYIISPTEVLAGTAQTLIIPLANYSTQNEKAYYYLEYRQQKPPFDVFSGTSPVVNGVSLRLATSYDANAIQQSQLIDTTPETASVDDAPLLTGKSFTDTPEGLTITTLSTDSTSAKVRITFTQERCVPMQPKVELLPTEYWNLQGGSSQYYVRITNLDSAGCGGSTFTTNVVLPSSITANPATLSTLIQPGKFTYIPVQLTTNTSIQPGDYTFTQTVSKNGTLVTVAASGVDHVQAETFALPAFVTAAPTDSISTTPTDTPTASITPIPTETPILATNTPVCATPPVCGINEILVQANGACPYYSCQPQGPTATPVTGCIVQTKPADFNNDGIVNLTDYSLLTREFLKTDITFTSDANCDGKVNLGDYLILVQGFLK